MALMACRSAFWRTWSNGHGKLHGSGWRRRLLSTKSKRSQEEVDELVSHHGRKKPASASLDTLLRTGRGEFLHKIELDGSVHDEKKVLIQISRFLRRELPIRLAHRIQDLSSVPYLNEMRHTLAVKHIYEDSLFELSAIPPIESEEDEEHYAAGLEQLYAKHSSVLMQMAKAAYELRSQMKESGTNDGFARLDACHTFLDRFYMSRIGIRVLAGQYLGLRQQHFDSGLNNPANDYLGIICKRTSPYHVVSQAAHDATWMCERTFGEAPEVVVQGNLDLTFAYIPTHLHYILLETIKNSMRATMERHNFVDSDQDVPPVQVVIADSEQNEDVVIKISDQGGGIARSNMNKIWSYLFTTASSSIQENLISCDDGETQDHSISSPLAGLGYGLPISRSYARYFGGELSIMSMEGYGTDVFLHLRRLGNNPEPLP